MLTVPGYTLAHNALELSETNPAAQVNGASLTLYTVPAGKVAYLASIYIAVANDGAALSSIRVWIRNAVPTMIWNYDADVHAKASWAVFMPFPLPHKLLAGWNVFIQSLAATLYERVTLQVFEE